MCFPRLYAAASLKRLGQPPVGLRARRFPRLYAAASLKPLGHPDVGLEVIRFPRLYAAASLKHADHARHLGDGSAFSAALCRGLIEARVRGPARRRRYRFSAALCRGLIEAVNHQPALGRRSGGFPRLYAAASLKR